MTITSRGSPDQISDPTMTAGADWFPENRQQILELWKRACVELESVAGTANAITATAGIPLDAYAKGQMWSLIPVADNTGAVTVNIDGKGARAVKDAAGAALSAGALVTGTMVILRDTGTNLRVVSAIGGAATQTTLLVGYQQSANVAGGTATGGARQQYPLNTEILNTMIGASFDDVAHQFDLPAGTYRVEANASFSPAINAMSIYLYNVTDSADVTTGLARRQGYQSSAGLVGIFTLASGKTLELQYSVSSTQATTGLGRALNDAGGAPEQYGSVMITRLG